MSAYAKITDVLYKKQTMKKSKKSQNHISIVSRPGVFAMVFVFAISVFLAGFSVVSADQYDQKIRELQSQNDQKENSNSQLVSEATSLQDTINKLQAEINAKQATINQHQNEVERLKKEIQAAEIELAKQKELLRETIKAIYIEGDITTLEMLASSDDLTDFFDKQQYRDTVQEKVKSTLDKITQLKLDLNTKKQKTEKLLEEQQKLKNDLLSQRGEKDRLLSLNEGERNKLDQEIKNNNSKIAELRRQQIAANARFSGGTGSIPDTSGYPWANYRAGSWTHAGSCYYGNDIDPWGMCYRQCVSYAAWKVWKTKGYMPYWGGRGNANLWDNNARAAGIPVDTNPRAGDIAVSNSGTWGHVMFVESVNGNGTINISQYNVSLTGAYSEATISASGLVFIHF